MNTESFLAKLVKCFPSRSSIHLQNIRYNILKIKDVDRREIGDTTFECFITKKCKNTVTSQKNRRNVPRLKTSDERNTKINTLSDIIND